MNLAISLILGNIAMLLGDIHLFQDDRHLCTIVGCLISYFYTASAFLLAFECHACFKVDLTVSFITKLKLNVKAITEGIMDGRSCVYLLLGWGTPMIALGYNIRQNLMDFGDDPRCFVGWSNAVKWQFFLPLLAGAGVCTL